MLPCKSRLTCIGGLCFPCAAAQPYKPADGVQDDPDLAPMFEDIQYAGLPFRCLVLRTSQSVFIPAQFEGA